MMLTYWKLASRVLKTLSVAAAFLVLLQITLVVISHGDPFIVGNLVFTLIMAAWCAFNVFSDGKSEYEYRKWWGSWAQDRGLIDD